MKKLSTQFLNAMSLCAVLVLAAGSAGATVYTAVQPGNYTDPNTWAGPSAPPINVTGDDIQIIGFNVILDTNVTFTGSTARLELGANGSLSQDMTPRYLSFSGAEIQGMGNIDVDSLYGDFGMNGYASNGILSTRAMTVASLIAVQPAIITVSDVLNLNGTCDIGMGSFSMGVNAVINVAGGALAKDVNGNVNLVQPYDVNYITKGTTTGLELSGLGLGNVSVDVGNGNVVTLTRSIEIDNGSVLSLLSGTLHLNGNRLVVTPNGDITGSNAADALNANSPSSIIINKAAGISRSLSFAAGATVDTLHINMSDAAALLDVEGDLKIAKALWIQDGMIDINDNDMSLIAGAALAGGDMDNYIIATNDGRLVQDVGANDVKFYPVGTAAYYAPANITGNTGHSAAQVSVGVKDEVLSNGTSGYDFAVGNPMVENTWMITSNTTATIDVDVELMWAAAQEVNSFDRSKSFASMSTGGGWSQGTGTAAGTVNGMHSQTYSNATALEVFAVFDNNTPVSIATVNAKQQKISIYPNPVSDVMHIDYNGEATATVYNTTGQVMMTANVSNSSNTIDVSALPAGMYYLQLSGEGVDATQRFVKQ